MKIIKKIREKHNKLIQKLDKPFFINMLIHVFPCFAFTTPMIFGLLAAEVEQIPHNNIGLLCIVIGFTFAGPLSFALLQNITNVEKNMKDCVQILIFDAIISYGTYLVVIIFNLLFH